MITRLNPGLGSRDPERLELTILGFLELRGPMRFADLMNVVARRARGIARFEFLPHVQHALQRLRKRGRIRYVKKHWTLKGDRRRPR